MGLASHQIAKAFAKQQEFVAWANSVEARFNLARRGLTAEGKRPKPGERPCEVPVLIERDSGERITVGAITNGGDGPQICAQEWINAEPPQRTRFESLKDYMEKGVHEAAVLFDLPDDVLELISQAEAGNAEAIAQLVERYKKDPKPAGMPDELKVNDDDLNAMAVVEEPTPAPKRVRRTKAQIEADEAKT